MSVPNPNMNETTGELVMLPGTELPNGAVVVAASARNAHEWILLAMRPGFHAGDDAYVTWKASRPGDGSDTSWGHYFDNIVDAARDYMERP